MWYLSFWIFPLISACTWLGMLIAMLAVWITEGSPRYASFNTGQRIAYISDIGAQGLKPLFIAGCCVTTVFLDLSFAAERWLRHTGALTRNTTMVEKILSALAILFAIAGTVGLILLSIFDTLRHPRMHDGFLLLFMAGYVISAIFICAEYQRLGIHFRDQRILRISFWIKLAFIIVEVALAIAFGVLKRPNVAAVLEWVIALIFTFWILSFFIDLLPAMRTKYHGNSAGAPQLELGGGARKGQVSNGRASGANGYGDETVDNTYTNGSAVANGGFRSGMTSGGYAREETAPNGGFRDGVSNGAYRNGTANGAVEHAGPGYNTVVSADGRPTSRHFEPARNF